jgi:hypothetical protein
MLLFLEARLFMRSLESNKLKDEASVEVMSKARVSKVR